MLIDLIVLATASSSSWLTRSVLLSRILSANAIWFTASLCPELLSPCSLPESLVSWPWLCKWSPQCLASTTVTVPSRASDLKRACEQRWMDAKCYPMLSIARASALLLSHRVHEERLNDRPGVGHSRRLDDDVIKVSTLCLEQISERQLQVLPDRAADAAVEEHDDVIVGALPRHDQGIVDSDVAKLVLDDRDTLAVVRGQNVVQQSRLSWSADMECTCTL